MTMTFAFFHSLENFHSQHELSKRIQSGPEASNLAFVDRY